jgi:hypothetical protein
MSPQSGNPTKLSGYKIRSHRLQGSETLAFPVLFLQIALP